MVRGKIKKMMAAALAATMVFTMTACGSDSEEKTADGYAKEIYLYNWSEYMSEDVLNKFEEEYGIKVVETTFESNDEMLAKLMAGGGSEYVLRFYKLRVTASLFLFCKRPLNCRFRVLYVCSKDRICGSMYFNYVFSSQQEEGGYFFRKNKFTTCSGIHKLQLIA